VRRRPPGSPRTRVRGAVRAILSLVLLLAAGCGGDRSAPEPASGVGAGAAASPAPAPWTVEAPREAAAAALEALSGPDPTRLAEWIHPERGLLFSPYAAVEPAEAVVLSAEEVRALPAVDPVRLWGYHDGTGEPIEATFTEYHARFVFDRDFRQAPRVSVDERIGTSTTLDNLRDVFPGATVVEYHDPGTDPALEGMDWGSLRLVLERDGGRWWLVAVVHDRWTT
jgi:hypothetical protein